MKVLLFSLLAVGIPLVYCQLGVKTRPQVSTGNLVVNYTHYDSNPDGSPVFPAPDSKAVFLNKTVATIPKGVCFEEVPTSSLVRGSSQVPAGNGSDPSLSKVQVCCKGYQRNPHVFRQCDPVCENECVNGLCVAPNVCECFPDHVRNLGGYCLATCPIGCGNGDCRPDGSCYCKPGYVLDVSGKFCLPSCNKGCLNGNCTAPDTCVCNQGYELSTEGVCQAKCDSCRHGHCAAPNVCECYPGYRRVESGCEPVCDKGCENGFCSAPNECTCNEGYTLSPSGACVAQPCDPACLNGECVGPRQCQCFQGYRQGPLPHVCVPHCAGGCPNGVCSSPNYCICNAGFMKDRGVKGREVCVPIV